MGIKFVIQLQNKDVFTQIVPLIFEQFYLSLKHISLNIILSRTDSIGDMVLTLPMAKIIKHYFPGTKVYFLGAEYTRAIVNACNCCDGFIELNEFLNTPALTLKKTFDTIIHVKPNSVVAKKAKQSGIKKRIGTTNRLFHWTTCNELVKLSRKKSNLHEAQLNLRLLEPFGIKKIFSHEEISNSYALENLQPLNKKYAALIDKTKYNLILHPKSRGSAREWGFDNFKLLIDILDKNKFKIFISGTSEEKELMQLFLDEVKHDVVDISGLMPLEQFISFVAQCNGLVACSTGPLHIAAALGKDALGIYAPLHSIRPQRWGPIGTKAKVFVVNKNCKDCYKNKMPCHCIQEIHPSLLKQALDSTTEK